jgi:hypothetical protein
MSLRRRAGVMAGVVTLGSLLGLSTRAVAAGSTSVDLGEARRRLEGVYARPPLDQLDKPRSETLFDRLTRALGDLFSRAAGGDRTLFLILGAAVLSLLAWLLLRRLRAVGAGMEPRLQARETVAGSDPDEEWTAALAAAQRGDHREAVRRAFRSALLAVALRGRLGIDPAWTTRELLGHTRADTDLLAALAPAAAAFDVAWYSGHPVTAADWELQRARCEVLRSLARNRLLHPHEAAR